MVEEATKRARERMEKAVAALESEFSKVRTGRAHASFLDSVQVDYYGTPSHLTQVASVSVHDAQTLVVSPWEKKMLPVIEKAVRDAGLGLNPVTVGDSMRVPMPALTEERRRELVKLVKQTAESAKVAIRNVRRDANAECKDAAKAKEISEDRERVLQEDIQKMTDHYVTVIDKLLQKKEEELMMV